MAKPGLRSAVKTDVKGPAGGIRGIKAYAQSTLFVKCHVLAISRLVERLTDFDIRFRPELDLKLSSHSSPLPSEITADCLTLSTLYCDVIFLKAAVKIIFYSCSHKGSAIAFPFRGLCLMMKKSQENVIARNLSCVLSQILLFKDTNEKIVIIL